MKLLTPEELKEANRLDLEEDQTSAFLHMVDHFRLVILEERFPGGIAKLEQLLQRRDRIRAELERVEAEMAALPLPGVMHAEPHVRIRAYRTGESLDAAREEMFE